MNDKLKKTETRKVVEDKKSLTVKFKLPKKLEQHLSYLEAVSKRPKSFIVKEALIQYLEDAEDISKVEE
jgi:predicted DNA-binding protein